jgi:hypothetical protein
MINLIDKGYALCYATLLLIYSAKDGHYNMEQYVAFIPTIFCSY